MEEETKKDLLEAYKEWEKAESQKWANTTQMQHDYYLQPVGGSCPNCGYCKHCGRGGYRYYPAPPTRLYSGWQCACGAWVFSHQVHTCPYQGATWTISSGSL